MDTEIKNKMDLFTKCNSLPKTELHAHLNGSIRKSTLIELLSNDDKEKLEKLYGVMDFENAMSFFKITSTILTNLNVVQRITKEMIEDWNKHNVIYLEIRTTLKANDLFSKEEYLIAVLNEIKQGNDKYDMVTRLIISLDRQKPIEDYQDTLKLYSQFKDDELKKLIVGIDYCGNEIYEAHKYEEVIPIFQSFRDIGLKVTIHMGENPNYQLFPFNKFVPDRISHAYFFKEIHYKEFMKLDIPIEVCPTSSMKITHGYDIANIPMKNFYKKKVVNQIGQEYIYDKITICTDDTMLILSDISQEYFEIGSAFNLSLSDMKNIILNSIQFIFETNEDVRQNIREKVLNYKC